MTTPAPSEAAVLAARDAAHAAGLVETSATAESDGFPEEPKARPSRRLAVKWKDEEEKILDFDGLGPADDLMARREPGLGFPVSTLLGGSDRLSADASAVVYWLACRKNGLPRLSFAAVLSKLGNYGDIQEHLSIEVLTDDEPEADPTIAAASS